MQHALNCPNQETGQMIVKRAIATKKYTEHFLTTRQLLFDSN